MHYQLNDNPVVRYLIERHAPVHEALVVSPKVWTMICPRLEHWHVMAEPIVSNGQLIGVVGCTCLFGLQCCDRTVAKVIA